VFNNNINVNEVIKEILMKVVTGIDVSLGIVSIILIGSTARKEETYIKKDNESKLLSDIEFLIVIGKKGNVERITELLNKNISRIYSRETSGLFHIDYSIYYENKLKFLDKRFINFETKYCGQVFWGDKTILAKFPDITIRNMNYSELQTVVIHRMYSVYKYLKILQDETDKIYILARNMLDIVTIILPYEKILLPTYNFRVNSVKNIMHREGLEKYFEVDEFINCIENCYLIKKCPQVIKESNINLEDIFNKFNEYIQKLYNYMKYKNNNIVFNIDKRGVLRSVISMSSKQLIKELKKPKKLEVLYKDLLRCLLYRDFVGMDETIKEKMQCLFNYS
jgi:predicted nucleotidyltransferase